MRGQEENGIVTGRTREELCADARERFSSYLDGQLDGKSMAALASHLEACTTCKVEFQAWRSMQATLAELGPADVPDVLQSQLRDTLAGELERGTYLSPMQRFFGVWQRSLWPAGLRLSAGFAGALLLVVSLSWLVGSVAPVQANDDRLANLNAPRYLYSMTPPRPIASEGGYIAVLVDARVNARGRVYDYDLIQGPSDPTTRLRIESNLLGSIFKPATLFGVPVPGHVMMTYTAVSVRG
ncbi:MAG: anti-sigma factor family protein [Janthinobacterium lividum]